ENIILGMEPKKNNIFIDMEQAIKKVEELSESMGFKIDPKAKIENISVGIQQRVEIIKVLYRGAEILVMDEPTAVLTPQEVEELFEILKSLKKQGKTIVFITHKLNEVKAISDRVTVMRKGKVVEVKDFTGISLIQSIQDAHQSRFTGSIFTNQSMYFSLVDFKIYIVVGNYERESFGDIFHL
ncbi:unnamed protein product, partial [marine sediment metagenome]